MFWILDLPLIGTVSDAFLQSILFGIIGLLLWNIFRFGNFERFSIVQKWVNYFVLALLTIIAWQGISFLFYYIFFGQEYVLILLPSLPVRIWNTLILYVLLLYFYRYKEIGARISEEEILEEPEVSAPITTEANPLSEVDILERIGVKVRQKIVVLPVHDIFYLQAEGDYVHIVTEKERFLKEQTMKYFETHLPPQYFVRVHRSYIVNIRAISRIEQFGKQTQQIILKNGKDIKVSAGGYKLLKSVLDL